MASRRDSLHKAGPPAGFTYVDLWDLLDLIATMKPFLRAGTFDEEPGELEVWRRANAILERYERRAS